MNKKQVAVLVQAIGSVIALNPTLPANANAPATVALRQDARAIKSDFKKAMASSKLNSINDVRTKSY